MSIRDHIRILKPLPIKESVVTKIRSLTEAYDIFPKSEGEIDTLDIPHNKDNLKALLKDVLSKSDGMADPIAISKNPKEKVVKIHRLVADNLNLPSLSKKNLSLNELLSTLFFGMNEPVPEMWIGINNF